jgi:phospholipid transport system substrate-binding protein
MRASGLTRRDVILALAAIAAFPAGSAMAAGADDYVKGVAGDVISLANSGLGKAAMRGRFGSLLNRYADSRSVSLIALGPFQKKIPAERRDEFFQWSLFYITSFFVYYIDEFKGADFQIKNTSQQGKFTTVVGNVRFKGGSTSPVRWRLVGGGGGYRINDVNIRGVWLSLQLKKRYNDILNRSKGDFDPLIEELKSAQSW